MQVDQLTSILPLWALKDSELTNLDKPAIVSHPAGVSGQEVSQRHVDATLGLRPATWRRRRRGGRERVPARRRPVPAWFPETTWPT